VNGNPHAFCGVGNGDNAYAIFLGAWHAMVDVTMADGVWNPVIVRNAYRGRGTWGTAPNTVTLDLEPQVARSADGTKIFYTWADADSSVILATANQSPNLYAKAYDVVQRKWTNSYNMTACNVTWAGKILFAKMAETVLSTTGNYKLPVVFAELGANSDPINPANFHYLDSIWFSPSDFVNNQCVAAVSISPLDTIIACGSATLDAGPGAQTYAWSTGAATQAITVTTSGSYSVGVTNGCCTGSDAVYVRMISAPGAAYSSSMAGFTGSFTNLSTGQLATYTWDFGDGTFSNLQNPTHTYTNPGNYTVCLTVANACGTDSTCSTVSASCAAANAAFSSSTAVLTATFSDLTAGNPSTWAWTFGDGNSSSLQNPTHTYTAGGTYQVCLTITDSCGSDSTCHTVTVCALPVAAFNANNVSLGLVDFTDQSTGGTSWLWTFGDGGTSTLQNPSHTYTTNGTYQVCLSVTDACGTDSTCTSVTVIVIGLSDGMRGTWSVSPIPAHDLLVLTAQDAPAGALRMRLMNTLGQLLMERTLAHQGGNLQERLDVNALPKGIYYLEVRGEAGSFVAKVIKE
jgi:PKD repeat protein